METAVTFIILIGCWTVCSSPSRPAFSFSMVFSTGTHVVVDVGEETADYNAGSDLPCFQTKSKGSCRGPSVQMLSSVPLSRDPGSAHLLVCLLNGLSSPRQRVLWWLNGTMLTSVGAEGPWIKSQGGYSATSVREVSAADWRSISSYWCGTIHNGRVYRQKLCSEDQ